MRNRPQKTAAHAKTRATLAHPAQNLRASCPNRYHVRVTTKLLQLALLLLAPALFAAQTDWAKPGPDGKLTYKKTERGDRIMDFSHAGYMGGGVALPDVAVKRTLNPTGADDSAAIQTAIDELAALPLEKHFRGAILLEPGTYLCSNTINIHASGIVLRGSGTNTILQLKGAPHPAITARATNQSRATNSTLQTPIRGKYIPAGADNFEIADNTGWAIGDRVEIRSTVTEKWIERMGMHDLVRDGKPQTWLRAGSTLATERQITAIIGRAIHLDAPLSDAIDTDFHKDPTLVKILPARLKQIGIENLRIQSPPQPISHTEPHFTAIRLNAEDAWIRNVLAEETMNSVTVTGRRITLQNVAVHRNARHEGSSKPAEFAPNASQILLDRCSTVGDNIWHVATGAGVAGPIVVLNCNFEGNGRAESHQRWSTGMLYDNCKAPAGGIEYRNRGSMGSGHGWTMGWGVIWNCEAKDFIVQNPPGALNWLIGSKGESKQAPRPFAKEPLLPEGTLDSHNQPVEPQSLYLAQLRERLGEPAVKNLGY